MQYSAFDIIALIIIAVLGIRGLTKGFVKEVLAKASYIIGFLAALMFAGLGAELIDQYLPLGEWSNVVSFILLFFAGFLLTRLFSLSFEKSLKQLRLKGIDSFLGFGLGLLEGAIVVSFIVFLLRLQNFIDPAVLLDTSRIASVLEPIAPYSIELVTGSI